MADPELKATGINVETCKGMVQLSGLVAAPEHVPKGAALARKVAGGWSEERYCGAAVRSKIAWQGR